MSLDKCDANVTGRREFLSRLSLAVAGSALAMDKTSRAEQTPPAAIDSPAPPLPTIRLGDHRVTRLIVGSNPISGYSYMGPVLDQHMREYFTPEQTTEFLWRCERAGINTHQGTRPKEMAGVFRTLRERGSKMKFICLHSGQPESAPIKQVIRYTQPIAIVHHGGVTDRLFRQGKSQEVHDFVKRVQDAGVLAGVSAHNPECVKRIADEGWPVDLFMTCFYYITRTPEELEDMPPVVTVQVGRPFFASDPTTMTQVMQQVEQPCLGFKILAAGRNCCDKESVREAFKFAFERVKGEDGVIVGMYPRYQDQIHENAEYARQFGMPRKT
ncbi:MAG: hypothetical protein JSU70_16570 [Phycisphaerales bacterium]|nr:MAG: hypothetical protein JSU70_16570 [Phycisphaerales bacterium]